MQGRATYQKERRCKISIGQRRKTKVHIARSIHGSIQTQYPANNQAYIISYNKWVFKLR